MTESAGTILDVHSAQLQDAIAACQRARQALAPADRLAAAELREAHDLLVSSTIALGALARLLQLTDPALAILAEIAATPAVLLACEEVTAADLVRQATRAVDGLVPRSRVPQRSRMPELVDAGRLGAWA